MKNVHNHHLARHRVARVKGFYVHALTFLAVNSFLFLLDALVPGGWWFYWPLLIWGIGLLFHALCLFGLLIFWAWNGKREKSEA
jgi:protein-S-isoprenylcysteine O-methyltransferase Ste14